MTGLHINAQPKNNLTKPEVTQSVTPLTYNTLVGVQFAHASAGIVSTRVFGDYAKPPCKAFTSFTLYCAEGLAPSRRKAMATTHDRLPACPNRHWGLARSCRKAMELVTQALPFTERGRVVQGDALRPCRLDGSSPVAVSTGAHALAFPHPPVPFQMSAPRYQRPRTSDVFQTDCSDGRLQPGWPWQHRLWRLRF